MPVAKGVRTYLIDGIEGTPAILLSLLRALSTSDPRWDARPFPDRFTLREAIAHVADWNPIFSKRLERMRDEDNPFLESVDEGQLCEKEGYASQDPIANLDRFTQTRISLVALLRSLPDEAWDRQGHREFIGDLTMAELVTTILGHDSYHLRQAAEYVGLLNPTLSRT